VGSLILRVALSIHSNKPEKQNYDFYELDLVHPEENLDHEGEDNGACDRFLPESLKFFIHHSFYTVQSEIMSLGVI
jgi:hypothetical protein